MKLFLTFIGLGLCFSGCIHQKTPLNPEDLHHFSTECPTASNEVTVDFETQVWGKYLFITPFIIPKTNLTIEHSVRPLEIQVYDANGKLVVPTPEELEMPMIFLGLSAVLKPYQKYFVAGLAPHQFSQNAGELKTQHENSTYDIWLPVGKYYIFAHANFSIMNHNVPQRRSIQVCSLLKTVEIKAPISPKPPKRKRQNNCIVFPDGSNSCDL